MKCAAGVGKHVANVFHFLVCFAFVDAWLVISISATDCHERNDLLCVSSGMSSHAHSLVYAGGDTLY